MIKPRLPLYKGKVMPAIMREFFAELVTVLEKLEKKKTFSVLEVRTVFKQAFLLELPVFTDDARCRFRPGRNGYTLAVECICILEPLCDARKKGEKPSDMLSRDFASVLFNSFEVN